jgi:uncharacterized protein YndB with AHSA1/START domain
MKDNVVSVERLVPAPPEAIFDLLADASRHPEFDGSGTVKQIKPGAPTRLGPGSTFGMSMQAGVKYTMVNTVVDCEENRRIAWQTRPGGTVGRFVAGRIWRFELEPAEGGTLVRESWDIGQDRQRALLRLGGLPEKTRRNMEKSLERIEDLVTAKG